MKRICRRDAVIKAVSSAVVLGTAGVTKAGPSESEAPAHRGLRVEHFTTPPGAELVSSIAVRPSHYRFSTLYSLRLPALRKGDVVQAHAQFEVTNNLKYNVMLAHAMLLHGEETIVVDANNPEERVLCEYAGENITPDMHHGFRTLIGSFAAEESGDAWVSVVIYAVSSAAKSGDRLRVEKPYGGLRAIVFRQGA